MKGIYNRKGNERIPIHYWKSTTYTNAAHLQDWTEHDLS